MTSSNTVPITSQAAWHRLHDIEFVLARQAGVARAVRCLRYWISWNSHCSYCDRSIGRTSAMSTSCHRTYSVFGRAFGGVCAERQDELNALYAIDVLGFSSGVAERRN